MICWKLNYETYLDRMDGVQLGKVDGCKATPKK